jgi:hypothetical protein
MSGPPPDDLGLLAGDLLRRVTPELAARLLDRAEADLFAAGRYAEAEAALGDLLAAPAVAADPRLRARVLALRDESARRQVPGREAAARRTARPDDASSI